MNNNNNDSSVDPEVTATRIGDDSGYTSYSLSSMTDLENDTVPSLESSQPSTSSTPQQYAPLGGGNPPPQHDVGGQGTGGASAYTRRSVQESQNVAEVGGSYRPQMNQAVPDDGCNLHRDPSQSSIASACYDPKEEQYDAVIICHLKDREPVEDLRKKLSEIILCDGKRARVALEDDDPSEGKLDTHYFDEWLVKAEKMFIYASENFFSDMECRYKEGVAIVQSFFVPKGKMEFVIPIFLENKYTAEYLSPSIQSITGIDFFNCKWNDRVANKFKRNLDMARSKILQRRQQELEAGVASMRLVG